jgi:ABC-type glycerol-3-phosphate transport system permease component
MGYLGVAIGIYFLILAVLFWWLGRTKLRTRVKIFGALTAVFLIPTVMYVDGLYREFGDGGAANTVLCLVLVIGGFLNAFVVFVFRSIRHESAL